MSKLAGDPDRNETAKDGAPVTHPSHETAKDGAPDGGIDDC